MSDRGQQHKTWICEWQSPNKFVADHPTNCRILFCHKCKCKTWHWPVGIADNRSGQERRGTVRRVDKVTSDLYKPIDASIPLHEQKRQIKYLMKYAEKRSGRERRDG